MAHVKVSGCELSYQVSGPSTGPTLVFCNAVGTTQDLWHRQVPYFSQRYRVVSFDYRGHGSSGTTPGPYSIPMLADDLIAVLDHLGVERASLCGLSLGGMVAMWLGAHRSERVECLALCSAAPSLGPAQRWTERAEAVRRQGLQHLIERFTGRWFAPGFLDRRPDARELVVDMVGACDPEGYAGACEAIAEADLRDDLSAIEAPTLVMSGADDPGIPPTTSTELHARISGSVLQIIPDTSHLLNIEQPERFNEVLLEHLERRRA